MNLHAKEIGMQSFFYFKLFICPPDEKRPKFFKGFTPESPSRLCHEPVAELTAPQDTHLHFTTFKNSIFFQKGTLVKLFGQMLALSIINSYYHLNDRGCSVAKETEMA